jgi:acyl carrier protein
MHKCDVNHLREFIANNFLFSAEFSLGDEDSFMEAGILDSIGVLHVILFLEENYQIKLADDEIVAENLDSIHNLKKFVDQKLSRTVPAISLETGLSTVEQIGGTVAARIIS